MAIEIEEHQPLQSPRALLQPRHIELQESRFRDSQERPQVGFFTTFRVLKGAGARDGEEFKQYINIAYSKDWDNLKLRPNTLAGQIVLAALKNELNEDDGAEELAERLIGKLFVAAIGTNKSGEYSRVVHDTVSPAPEPKKAPEPRKLHQEQKPEQKRDSDLDDWDDIPF